MSDEYQSNIVGCYIEAREDEQRRCAISTEGSEALFRASKTMPPGLFEVNLEGYAIIPIEKYKSISRPWWRKLLRLS